MKPRSAFTLVELMASIAILSLLVLVLSAIMNSASSTIGSSFAKVESNQEGRLVFDRLQIDFQNMLLRPDIDYQFVQQAGNDTLAFYATEPGYTTASNTKRVAAVINYVEVFNSTSSGQPMLQRGANDAFQWNPATGGGMIFSSAPSLQSSSSSISVLQATTLDLLDADVFRFELSFLLKDPLTGKQNLVAAIPTQTAIGNVAAIVVTIAALDGGHRKIISSGAWPNLVTTLKDAADGTPVSQTWNAEIQSTGFATAAGIPASAASAVRVYERYFYLNSPPVVSSTQN